MYCKGVTMKRVLVLLCITRIISGNELDHGHEEEHEGTADPYHNILEFYGLNNETNFTIGVLQQVSNDFAAKIHCGEEEHDDHDGRSEECASNFTLNMSTILTSLGEDNVAFINEDLFDEISLIFLETVISFNGCCRSDIQVTNATAHAYRDSMADRLTGGNVTSGVKLESVQNSLELIDLVADDTVEDDDHPRDGADDHHGDEEEEDHTESDEEHSHELIMEKCLGADILFDQLGLDFDGHVSIDNAGKIASLAVFHILSGAKVSRDCRILPRKEFFFDELDHIYGHGNHTLGKNGFSRIMEDLQLGDLHHDSETEEDNEHAHRRKRSMDEDNLLHKSSWETQCFTDEQLLAIFHAEESEITAEEFQTICPALIQQKITGVCAESDEHADESDPKPSTSERYGYGSLATFIICLCSVAGAVVVRVASSKAYDVIMALFLGLAVATLFTDSILHLLPAAVGIHDESAHAHDQSGGGIVVEEYVWYSLVACAALYVFYLFEKTMVLVRGKHIHSHSSDDIIRENDIKISIADTYEVKPVSKTKKKDTDVNRGQTMSNGAVMILMGDAVHNFADGLAIGASFSSSLALGLSTTIAVFCHELPHELGDFAFLLSSGISFGRALILNALISLTAMIGLYVGLVISDDESVKRWIFAVAAGMFIYVSLVDMMPKLLQKTTHGVRDFILHNVGILIGTGIMIVLAVFEEKISVSL